MLHTAPRQVPKPSLTALRCQASNTKRVLQALLSPTVFLPSPRLSHCFPPFSPSCSLFQKVSNQPASEDEFRAWEKALRDQREAPLTTRDVEAARQKLLNADK